MADLMLTQLTAISQGNVDNNVLLYCVDITGGTVDRKVTRANLYLAVANTWTKGQTFTPDTATALAVTPPTVPVGSGSPFFAGLSVATGTVAFATTAQTGDYDTVFIGQATLTNPSTGTITNSASVKIAGAPIASTNVTITNNYAFWVAAGVSRFDEQVKITSVLNTPLLITAASAPTGSSSEFVAWINSLAATTAFATTAQSGDFIARKMGQITLTNPSAGTITNAATLKIVGAPIASTNVTITNAYAMWVAAGVARFDGNVQLGTLVDSNGNTQLTFTATASAVNYLTLVNAATGNAVQLQMAGSDSNVGLKLVPKGTGEAIGVTETLIFPLGDESTVPGSTSNTDVTKITYYVARAGKLVWVEQCCTVAPTSTVTLDIKLNGTTIFSTRPTIAGSANTGSNGVLTNNPQTLSKGDKLEFCYYNVGSSETIAGAKLTIGVYRTS